MNANYSEALEQQVRLLQQSSGFRVAAIEKQARKHLGVAEEAPETGAAELMARSVLERADTFFWSPVMRPLLEHAASTLTSWKLDQGDVPTESGFVWLGEVNAQLAATDAAAVRRAFGWQRRGDGQLLCIDFAETRMPGMSGALIIPNYWFKWKFGEGLSELGASFSVGSDADRRDTLDLAKYMAAAFALMRQRIVVPNTVRAERHARRRLERAGWMNEPVVRVIELRRREHVGTTQAVERAEHDWQCQWLVRGHWRQQFYPSKHANQPIWITPYVKGPDDKPLKPPRATVFAVVR